MEKSTLNKGIKWIIGIGIWIGIWQFLAYVLNEEVLLVSPLSVFQRILKEGRNLEFWLVLGNTAFHILCGFGMGTIIGFFIAVASFYSSFLKTFFHPLIIAIQGTPIISFIILLLLWIPTSILSIMISSLIVLPLFYRNTYLGLKHVSEDYLAMAKVFNWSERKKWKYLYFPSLKYFLGSAMFTGIGMAWKAGLAAEVIGLPTSSMGEKLYESKVFLDTQGLLAYTVMAVLCSFVMERGLMALWKPLKSDV